MMQQWQAAKAQHPDALLFFRMGDFYELFGQDAVEAARVLELTLTSRDKKKKEGGLPMAGVPHHALQNYLARLIERGYRVAVCDQLEDPKQAKGIVKRGVTRVVSPGVVIDDVALEPSRNNYLGAVWPGLAGYGVAYADVTTGELRATLAPDLSTLASELARIEARELLVPPNCEAAIGEAVRRAGGATYELQPSDFDMRRRLANRASSLSDEGRRAIGAIEVYLDKMRPNGDVALRDADVYSVEAHLGIDDNSFRNLEVVATLVGGRRKGSLLGLLDRTVTAMGARQLRRWLQRPLRDRTRIEARLEAVAELVGDALLRDDLQVLFADVYDVERLGGRINAGLATPKDLANLRRSLGGLGRLQTLLATVTAPRLRDLAASLDPLTDIYASLSETLDEEPAQSPAEGRVIRPGFDAEVDELAQLARSGKDWLLSYEQSERERTTIGSLKVRYNRVFGYYIEVTRANLHLVPEGYIRKQTIANGERYFTMELKEYESKVLNAEEQRIARETTLFEALRVDLKTQSARILRTASRVADLDVLCGLADAAHRYGYVRPTLTDGHGLRLLQSRHPVVEQSLDGADFVPNDVDLAAADPHLVLITGPNMAGKSTVMRQVALTVLMAQIGSFVPAREAEIGVVDRIFTRVGATDDLSRGQSTFMVEMSETAFILRHATNRSLIILDEIGRGTSTFDGLSIAWAVAEYIHDVVGARTMFATHYHELTELARNRENVRNVHVAVREWNEDIVFLRKLEDGGTNRSYGIAVGRLAGLPDSVVSRAREVLAGLEQTDISEARSTSGAADGPGLRSPRRQLGLFEEPEADQASSPSEIEQAIARVDVSRTTPLEALRLIDRLQRKLLG